MTSRTMTDALNDNTPDESGYTPHDYRIQKYREEAEAFLIGNSKEARHRREAMWQEIIIEVPYHRDGFDQLRPLPTSGATVEDISLALVRALARAQHTGNYTALVDALAPIIQAAHEYMIDTLALEREEEE